MRARRRGSIQISAANAAGAARNCDDDHRTRKKQTVSGDESRQPSLPSNLPNMVCFEAADGIERAESLQPKSYTKGDKNCDTIDGCSRSEYRTSAANLRSLQTWYSRDAGRFSRHNCEGCYVKMPKARHPNKSCQLWTAKIPSLGCVSANVTWQDSAGLTQG